MAGGGGDTVEKIFLDKNFANPTTRKSITFLPNLKY